MMDRCWLEIGRRKGKQSGSVSECGKPSLLSHLILLWWCPMVSVFRQERERGEKQKEKIRNHILRS